MTLQCPECQSIMTVAKGAVVCQCGAYLIDGTLKLWQEWKANDFMGDYTRTHVWEHDDDGGSYIDMGEFARNLVSIIPHPSKLEAEDAGY
jgi:hypothetical protein